MGVMTAQVKGAVLACVLPPAAAAAVVLFGGSPASTFRSVPPQAWARLAAATFVLAMAVTVAIAPLLGVALAADARRHGGRIATGRLLVLATTYHGASLLVQVWLAGAASGTNLVVAQATCWIATMALAAVGAACGARFADPLDAAACAVGGVLVSAFAVLLAGPLLDRLPPTALGLVLLANPIVAVASAAGIDLFHTDVLYPLSPIAHMQVSYPSTSAVCVSYAALALVLFAAAARRLAGRAPAASLERMSV